MSTSPTVPKNHQLEPLELNPTTGEAFLRVEGFDDIIITAQRWEDKEACVPYLNDPRVADFMSGPPLPYLPERAEKWMNHIIPPQTVILSQLEEARDQERLLTVGGCPVNAIRKVNEDGSDAFIGAIDISRHVGLGELVPAEGGGYTIDKSVKEENEKRNKEREVGDPEIAWVFGDYLAPAYHSRGIMTACVNTILHKWAVPRMNVHIVRAVIFGGNIASEKVFLKNGFKRVATLPDYGVVRGDVKTLEVFEWKRE